MQDQDDIGYSSLDEMSLKNQSVSESDDEDEALADAENQLLAMLAPVNSDCGVPSLTLGSFFDNKESIRSVVLRAESNIGRRVYVKKQEAKIVLFLCKGKDCLFRARFSFLKRQQWQLTVLNDQHTCLPEKMSVSKSNVLRPVIEQALLVDPSMKPSSLHAYAEGSLNVPVRRHMVHLVKKQIQHLSAVEEGKLFNRLPAIFDHLSLKDPGGHFVLEKHADDRFSQLFISPSFAKSCFENAKPVIGIDGAHTRNAIKQILLLATVKDGNNTIMVIAFGIVAIESSESWRWFLSHLKQHIPSIDRDGVTIVSDRDKGIMDALPLVFPRCSFSWCCQHLAQNVQRKQGAGGVGSAKMFWMIARSTTPEEYAERLLALKEANVKAYNYVLLLPKERYCNALFPSPRFGNMTSNLVEAINGAFRNIRCRPIVHLIEGIWEWMAKKRYDRSTMETTTILTPNAFKYLTQIRKEASSYVVATFGVGVATVRGCNGCEFEVNLTQNSCTCGLFNDLQFPCRHALKVIDIQGLTLLDSIHPCYRSATFKVAYSQIIPAVQLRRLGEGETDVNFLPPIVRRGKGRPKTTRGSAGVYHQNNRTRNNNL